MRVQAVVKNTIAVFIPPKRYTRLEFEGVKKGLNEAYISEAPFVILPPEWTVEYVPLEGRQADGAAYWGPEGRYP